MVQSVTSLSELQKILAENPAVAIDFFAEWCGPCKRFAPTFEKLSGEHKGIKFIKVDVDQAEDIAAKYAIEAMPTFKFIKNGEVVSELVGASESDFVNKLKMLQ